LNWNPRLAVLLVEIPCRKCVGKQLHDFASTISEGSRTLGPWNLRGSKYARTYLRRGLLCLVQPPCTMLFGNVMQTQ
jgi:hypothetical protein